MLKFVQLATHSSPANRKLSIPKAVSSDSTSVMAKKAHNRLVKIFEIEKRFSAIERRFFTGFELNNELVFS